MRYWVGFDVGKAFHWVCVLNEEGEVVLSRKVEATERGLEACREELAAFGDPSERRIGVDLVGGPPTLLQAVLLGGGERLFRISSMALITFGEEEGFRVNAGALFLLLAAVSASIYVAFQKPYLEKHARFSSPPTLSGRGRASFRETELSEGGRINFLDTR